MNTTDRRLTLISALATCLVSLTLVPLLEGVRWTVWVAVPIVTLGAVGLVARRWLRWWPAVVLLQIAAAVLALTQLFARQAALGGVLPGPAVWTTFAGLAEAGLSVSRKEVPPVPAGPGVLLVVTVGMALIGLLVDVIAVSLRRPAVGGLPLLAVYCVPAAVLPEGLSWVWFVLAAVGYLLLVGSEASGRVRSWGHVLVADRTSGGTGLGTPFAGARRLTIGCLIAAVLIPAAVPGLGERLLGGEGEVAGKGPGGSITVINPILRIGEDLKQRDDAVVIRYRTPLDAPEPLRIVSDDAFDGTKWEPSKGKISRSNRVQNGLPPPPGLGDAIEREPLRTEIVTLALNQTYLPLPYPATKVSIEGPWLFDDRTLNVVGDHIRTRDLSYSVDHLAVHPTVQQLKDAPPAPGEVVDLYGKLPPNTPREIGARARAVAGNGGDYDRAIALQQWFRTGGKFVYSENVQSPAGKEASSQDAILAFLRTRRGYCVQFASTMAVMARTLGIPSRVGVGFLPGTKRSDGTWEISVKDAHAWPELYFDGVGWVRFEPTPSARSGAAPEWSVPRSKEEAPEPSATATATATATMTSAVPEESPAKGAAPRQEEPPVRRDVWGGVPWKVLGVIALLVLLAATPFTLTRLVRARRWSRAGRDPSGPRRVEAAWNDLRERLEDLGVGWASSWTPRALQTRLSGDHDLSGSERVALGRLVADVEEAWYAPPGEQGRSGPELRSDVDLVMGGVTRSASVPAWTRRRARWLPLSGWRSLTGAVRRADLAAGRAGQRVGTVSSSIRRRAERAERR
ncbi:MAG: hypothetical protein QG622_2514 [Actinomycetota bacterium]|nr:hypothetical protein [Actinomycetota bacterium]